MSKLGTIAKQGLALPGLSAHAKRVLTNMSKCQTEALGYNVERCSQGCDFEDYHYNSCRDRHCPLCQGYARAKWVNERLNELLPCPYFHVVFTVPKEIRPLALAHKRVFFRCLFAAAHGAILKTGAKDPKINGKMGGLSVLHTWNQKLAFHPHLHCIVPGGALSHDRSRWIAGSASYLLPTRKLALLFRGIMLSELEKALGKDELLPSASTWVRQCLKKSAKKDWLVYAKAPFGGPEQVFKYLGRYTHRVGISEQRIVSCTDSTVRFSWIDRANGRKKKIMKLGIKEFVDKFCQHLLPKGLRKIRHFGFLANRDRSLHHAKVLTLMAKEGLHLAIKNDDGHETKQPAEAVKMAHTCQLCGAAMIPILPKSVLTANPITELERSVSIDGISRLRSPPLSEPA